MESPNSHTNIATHVQYNDRYDNSASAITCGYSYWNITGDLWSNTVGVYLDDKSFSPKYSLNVLIRDEECTAGIKCFVLTKYG